MLLQNKSKSQVSCTSGNKPKSANEAKGECAGKGMQGPHSTMYVSEVLARCRGLAVQGVATHLEHQPSGGDAGHGRLAGARPGLRLC